MLLNDLAEAAESLQNEGTIVGLVAEALSSLAPGCVASAYTTRGMGRVLGPRRVLAEGETLPEDEEYRRLYATVYLPVDRLALRSSKGWVEAVREGLLTADQLRQNMDRLPAMRPFRLRECGFFVVGLGPIPLASGNLKVPAWGRPFSAEQRARLRDLVARVSQPLRLAALMATAGAGLHALDHLLANRADAVFLVSPVGQILGASPAAERLISRSPGLALAVGRAARGSPFRASSLAVPDLGLEMHVSPCSARGSAPALLVVVGAADSVGRGRLSPRQTELLERLEEGLGNKEIAQRMGLAPSTVKSMLERLYRHAGVSGRVGLLHWARTSAARIAAERAPAFEM